MTSCRRGTRMWRASPKPTWCTRAKTARRSASPQPRSCAGAATWWRTCASTLTSRRSSRQPRLNPNSSPRPRPRSKRRVLMARVVDTLIPVTMVGSYPRPRWYTRRSNGMDMREFLMDQNTREEYEDAVKAVIKDQEIAGLDIVSDGEMFEDDLVGAIGWPEYVTSRIGGMQGRGDPPMAALLNDPAPIIEDMVQHWPGRVITERVTRGPLRFAHLYQRAKSIASRPIKASYVDPQFV